MSGKRPPPLPRETREARRSTLPILDDSTADTSAIEPASDLVRLLVHDTSWHGPNDEADWSKGYWTHPGRVAEIVGADNARLTAALGEADSTVRQWVAIATKRSDSETDTIRSLRRALGARDLKRWEAEADAATGRAVGRRALDVLRQWTRFGYPTAADHDRRVETQEVVADLAAWLASLDDGEGT